ncbi:MAG: bacillithiol biosynthesis cysteine-adding enzyme BshC [Bacteroidetes bacterium]|nr:bacillithiol biosynthesis cysteine-adding enzyme BshC [Bacteroidota bacterium]MDA1120992.1 bacillithiol biosynthesis cysteine-adding enzyme BshC [Bacteroidota bacterium]
MNLESITLDEAGCFSPLFTDYIKGEEKLKPHYGPTPHIESFQKLILERNFPQKSRQILQEVLHRQYGGIEKTEKVKFNLDLITKDNTYTITTGHQLNLFTGALYFIYKIVTVINACKRLKEQYPDSNFIPIYWMASEDHDLEEISHFNLFGKKHQWETDQAGAVGHMNPQSIAEQFSDLPDRGKFFIDAYAAGNTLAGAVRSYVNILFGDQGLLVIDADDRELKHQFSEVILDDIFSNTANQLVEKAATDLNALGYKTQVFPREINFFYLDEGFRGRIIRDGDVYRVKKTELVFSPEELKKLIHESPEKFSPNVILRPLYQETILPNLAYIGGPAEIAYWLQLKEVFGHYKTPFPMLMPRNFALVISKTVMRKIEKTGLRMAQLFLPLDKLKKQFVAENTDKEIHLDHEISHVRAVFETIKEKAMEVDKSLGGLAGAEQAKTLKSLENIEKRIKKSEEQNQQVGIQQIESVKEKLFPHGHLQERHDNFLNFYVNDDNFLQELMDKFDPFNYSFHIFKEEEVREPAT